MSSRIQTGNYLKPVKLMDSGGKKTMVLIFLIGITLFYGAFYVFPIFYALVGSFFYWNPMIGKFDFNGVNNYIDITNDSVFWQSMLQTVYFTAAIVVLRTFLGVVIAVAINAVNRFKSFFRTIYFIPAITSIVAASLVWKKMYDPTFGSFNQILSFFGIAGPNWLKDPSLALTCIMIVTLWKDLGYAIVIYLAGLTGIPRVYYEAAEIDGAGKIQVFWKVTMPLLSPTTLFLVVTSIIVYLQTFTQVFVITEGNRGGPGTSCYTLAFMLYRKAFVNFEFGTAASISFILFVLILFFSIVQMRLMKSDWRY